MQLISDILLAAGAFGAGLYCMVLARRLTRFTDLEKGVGGAVAVLSSQVDDMTRSVVAAQKSAAASAARLEALTVRAEEAEHRLELMIAAMHDLPEPLPKSIRKPDFPQPTAATPQPVVDPLFLSQRVRVPTAAE